MADDSDFRVTRGYLENLNLDELELLAYRLQIQYTAPLAEEQKSRIIDEILWIRDNVRTDEMSKQKKIEDWENRRLKAGKPCVNMETATTMKNVNLLSNDQIVFLLDPEEKKYYCFDRVEDIPYLLSSKRNPWTNKPLTPRQLEYLMNMQQSPYPSVEVRDFYEEYDRIFRGVVDEVYDEHPYKDKMRRLAEIVSNSAMSYNADLVYRFGSELNRAKYDFFLRHNPIDVRIDGPEDMSRENAAAQALQIILDFYAVRVQVEMGDLTSVELGIAIEEFMYLVDNDLNYLQLLEAKGKYYNDTNVKELMWKPSFVRETYYNSSNLRERWYVDEEDRKSGSYTQYWNNGRIKTKGYYHQGLVIGRWERFSENEKIQKLQIFNNDSNIVEMTKYAWKSEEDEEPSEITKYDFVSFTWVSEKRDGSVWRKNGVGEFKHIERSPGKIKIYEIDEILTYEIDPETGNENKVFPEGPKNGYFETVKIGKLSRYDNSHVVKSRERGRYENDVKVGEWREENKGDITMVVFYVNGVRDGPYELKKTSSSLVKEQKEVLYFGEKIILKGYKRLETVEAGRYNNGEKDLKVKTTREIYIDEKYTVITVSRYEDGKLNGLSEVFVKGLNGQKYFLRSTEYKDDVKHGETRKSTEDNGEEVIHYVEGELMRYQIFDNSNQPTYMCVEIGPRRYLKFQFFDDYSDDGPRVKSVKVVKMKTVIKNINFFNAYVSENGPKYGRFLSEVVEYQLSNRGKFNPKQDAYGVEEVMKIADSYRQFRFGFIMKFFSYKPVGSHIDLVNVDYSFFGGYTDIPMIWREEYNDMGDPSKMKIRYFDPFRKKYHPENPEDAYDHYFDAERNKVFVYLNRSVKRTRTERVVIYYGYDNDQNLKSKMEVSILFNDPIPDRKSDGEWTKFVVDEQSGWILHSKIKYQNYRVVTKAKYDPNGKRYMVSENRPDGSKQIVLLENSRKIYEKWSLEDGGQYWNVTEIGEGRKETAKGKGIVFKNPEKLVKIGVFEGKSGKVDYGFDVIDFEQEKRVNQYPTRKELKAYYENRDELEKEFKRFRKFEKKLSDGTITYMGRMYVISMRRIKNWIKRMQ